MLPIKAHIGNQMYGVQMSLDLTLRDIESQIQCHLYFEPLCLAKE